MRSNTLLSVFGLVASASAHMKMSNPKGWFVNNSPLDASGSDFPCKGVDYSAPSDFNVYQQGQSAPLTFIGQAVHGGGSCQISLTTDTKPTKNSVWRVIKSIEGGCPAQGEQGNMGDNAEAEDPYKYEFTIPEDVPAGNYTIAWTWFNKIGNREMYMNCGPASVTGGAGSESAFNALPEMFTANIGNGCGTKPTTDLEFPNPGQAVERLNGASDAFAAPTGSCPSGSGGAGGAGSNDAGAPAPTPTAEPDSGKGSGKGSGNLPGAVFVTVDTPASEPTGAANDAGSAPQPTQAAQLPDAETPAQDPPASAPEPAVEEPIPTPAPVDSGSSDNSGSTGGGSAFAAGTPCNQDGFWNCIGGNSFQRCASGIWSVSQSLAAGTSCSGGVSETIALTKRGVPVKAPRFGAKMRL